MIVITSISVIYLYQAELYKQYTFTKSELEVNWRKKLKTIDTCSSPHIFIERTTDELRLDFV